MAVGATPGVSTTFLTASGDVVTVVDGIIVSVEAPE